MINHEHISTSEKLIASDSKNGNKTTNGIYLMSDFMCVYCGDIIQLHWFERVRSLNCIESLFVSLSGHLLFPCKLIVLQSLTEKVDLIIYLLNWIIHITSYCRRTHCPTFSLRVWTRLVTFSLKAECNECFVCGQLAFDGCIGPQDLPLFLTPVLSIPFVESWAKSRKRLYFFPLWCAYRLI